MHPTPIMSFLSLSRAAMVCAAMLALSACGTAPGRDAGAPQTPVAYQDSFEVASTVSENDLSEMRGGFLMAGGLSIDFGLTTTTLVNGNVQSSLNLSSHGLHGTLPQNINQLIQVGASNSYNPNNPASLTNNVLTIVQNNTNNSVIQNTNVLNLNVSSLSNLRNQAALLNSFGPMIRSLH